MDFAADRILLAAGFTKAVRDPWVPPAPELRRALEALPIGVQGDGRLLRLLTPDGRPAGLKTVWGKVNRLARRLGLKRSLHPLRRGFGCRYAGKVPAQVLQRLLRHAGNGTTMTYYANVDDAAMEAVSGPNVTPHVTVAGVGGGRRNGTMMRTLPGTQVESFARPWARALKKYVNIFRVSLIERMAYRGDFLLGSILRFFPMITTVLLWQAVYEGAGADRKAEGGQTRIAGFDLHEMVAYLLLVHVSRMFSSMPGLSGGIARDIRDGSLKKYLIQPLDMIGYLVSYRAAHKVAYICTSFLPYAVMFYLCAGYFDQFPGPAPFAAYILSLLLAFVVGFFFECAMGMVGFWFLEVTSLLWVVNTLNYFVSGQMFPLDLLPPFWAAALKALPFQYLAYFPAAVFLGKIRGAELAQGLLAQSAWALVLIVLSRWLYARGLRRYGAYGG